MNLRWWLRRPPVPRAVRCVLGDGTAKIVRLGDSRRKYADAEAAILALGAERAEALDARDEIIRTTELAQVEDEQREVDPPGRQSSELAQLMKIAGDSADRAAGRHEAAYRMGFDQLAALVRVLSDRLAGLERQWMRQIREVERRAEELQDSPPNGTEGMIGQLLTQAALGGVASPPPKKKVEP